jgi:hypothetical protein
MPDRHRVVVVNTTPIISLVLIGKLDLLQQLYDEVLIPPAVESEVLAGGTGRIGVGDFRVAGYIRSKPLSDPSRADLLSDLDRGEAEVIALAQELSADLVIIDEKIARKHALRVGLNITGVLGVLLRAKEKGLIQEVKPLLEKLQNDGIWLAPEIVNETLRLAKEL